MRPQSGTIQLNNLMSEFTEVSATNIVENKMLSWG